MRIAYLAALAAGLAGCHPHGGGSGPGGGGGDGPQAQDGFPATRWVPEKPTYVVAARTVREAQRGLRDLFDSAGAGLGVGASDASREIARMIAIDPLSTEDVANAGIDLDGGIVAFSDDVAPTFVVHLAAPDATAAWFDKQRERGLTAQSVIADGVELFSATLPANLVVSWAIDHDWLWVHFAAGTKAASADDGRAWFVHSHHPGGGAWTATWKWARGAAGGGKPGLLGFLDPTALLAAISPAAGDAIACVQRAAPVRRIGFELEGDATHAAGRIALDIGPAAAAVAAALHPEPEGFAAVARTAPIAGAVNVDLFAFRAWAEPCLRVLDLEADLERLDAFGVRAARGALLSLDADRTAGSGVVALDLAKPDYFEARLDDIPLRSTLERRRAFGPLQGHSLTVPFVATIDYVLTDKLALAAVGDGVLARVVGSGKTVPGPLLSLDVTPPALSAESWKAFVAISRSSRGDSLAAIDDRMNARVVERLLRWRALHLALTLEGTSLVLSAAGDRR